MPETLIVPRISEAAIGHAGNIEIPRVLVAWARVSSAGNIDVHARAERHEIDHCGVPAQSRDFGTT